MKRIIKTSKKTKSNSESFKGTVTCIVSLAILCSCVFLPKTGDFFGKMSLLSAGAVLPEGGEYILENQIKTAVNGSLPRREKGVTEENTEVTRAPEVTAAPVSVDFTGVPDDIKAQIEAAEKKYANASHDGKIVSKSYEKSGATHTYQNVLVKNNTNQSLDIAKVLNEKADLKIPDKSKPTVLIFHTHTTESYQMLDKGWYTKSYVTRSNDPKTNMVRVGDEITEQLRAAGFNVIHDTKIYDTTYNGSYDRSGAAIDKHLKENPSIQVLLDVHRDAMQQSDGTRLKPTTTINGKKAAQIMIISGCEEGSVKNFPDWKYNLRFAMELQKQCQDEFPSLMRPLYFSRRKYNMHKTHCSLLIEFGSDSNTLDEAAYSGRLFGKALADMMGRYCG